jgi:hypothetical protein
MRKIASAYEAAPVGLTKLAQSGLRFGPSFDSPLAELAELTRETADRSLEHARDRGLTMAKIAAQLDKRAAADPNAQVKAPGALRTSASSAWNIGMNPPKPKTIQPTTKPGAEASSRAIAKPPSKTSYYKDVLSSLNDPQRGSRLATPTG